MREGERERERERKGGSWVLRPIADAVDLYGRVNGLDEQRSQCRVELMADDNISLTRFSTSEILQQKKQLLALCGIILQCPRTSIVI